MPNFQRILKISFAGVNFKPFKTSLCYYWSLTNEEMALFQFAREDYESVEWI